MWVYVCAMEAKKECSLITCTPRLALHPSPLVRVANEEVPHNLYGKRKRVCVCVWLSE